MRRSGKVSKPAAWSLTADRGRRSRMGTDLNAGLAACMCLPFTRPNEKRKNFEMICERCGTSKRPIGPRHCLDGRGRDCLRYACCDCGYSWTGEFSNTVVVPRTVLKGLRAESHVLAKAEKTHKGSYAHDGPAGFRPAPRDRILV